MHYAVGAAVAARNNSDSHLAFTNGVINESHNEANGEVAGVPKWKKERMRGGHGK